ncbi:adenosylcobinamide-phosphate synthase [Sphaerotilus hippei]|uniref:Cobalamin biosynthesis protein CobD n=1 Tax=Sphaerotilus hippei TaxID=744406 RepID=A0A318GVD5_9BURK|nr:adenosylcobinamide-phosphate synthase CbiB [Sphaerotilus hippei]PXW93276.1 adenosylcobinamide-phosphate synthase [Sphaerotilus hippei]
MSASGWLALLCAPAPWPLALAGALLLAWLGDRRWGEPPDAWHPVAWLGRVLGPVGRRLRRARPALALPGGALAWTVLAGLLMAAAAWLQARLLSLPALLALPLLAVLLKPLFAWRMLHDEVAAVGAALQQGLEPGRQRLARLVSRDVTVLDASQVRESAIETLAENLNDSFIAPLAWLLLLGLPGAVLYRFANTADAMWGYRGAWEWAGKWAARADDLLSWPTARVSALLLRPCWRPSAWGLLADQAALTPSPNGGWPMGAMALQLGVRLSKPGVYVLNAAGRPPESSDLQGALLLATLAAHAWLGLLLTALAGLGLAGLPGAADRLPGLLPWLADVAGPWLAQIPSPWMAPQAGPMGPGRGAS